MNEIAASSWAGSSSEDVRGLMDRERLRDLLIEGASSEPTGPVDDSYFDALRDRAGR
ncbi:type II toxin-antitoxin system ParD family antitoxin [Rhizobium hidalgonense]|nr:type II toxin-antitoxin system ParD family antitoxin [Rhizobium hidalgonense]